MPRVEPIPVVNGIFVYNPLSICCSLAPGVALDALDRFRGHGAARGDLGAPWSSCGIMVGVSWFRRR